jgi:hypothetical protein
VKFGFFIFLVALVIGNLVVTVAVIRSISYDKAQKKLQCLFIWFVPIIGALLAWYLLREHKTKRVTTDVSDTERFEDGHINQDAYSESAPAESGAVDAGAGD